MDSNEHKPMKKFIILILFVLSTFSIKLSACDFTVNLYDSYGDGWNGNSITIQVNGAAVLTGLTIANGSGPESHTFTANDGDVITISYDNSGDWQSENWYEIINDQGLPNFSDGSNGATPTGGTFTADCGSPPPPPTNTDPCSADPLTIDTTCVSTSYTTEWATSSSMADPNCGNYGGGDVWFTATVPTSGNLLIETGAGTLLEMGLAIYTGTDCNSLTEINCSASTWEAPMASIEILNCDGLAGQTIWIRAWETGNDNPGIFNICAYEHSPPDYNNLVNDSLVTGCLEAFNVCYTGNEASISSFYDANASAGFESGIMLSSGNTADFFQSGADFASTSYNEPGDTDLDNILVGFTTNDAAVLEFDFVPQSDSLSFRYIFGSEEYPEWVNSSFNDVFAFLLTGPNPAGGTYNNTNIALIPGTTLPVAIDNINDVTPSYPQYYIDNQNGTNIVMDGITTVLTARAPDGVVPCETYHIKLAVADAGDNSYDSAVLLEAGSFTSGGSVSMENHSQIGTEHDIYEGCENYYVFSRTDTSDVSDSLEVVFTISGTADNGGDITYIDSIFYIPSGDMYDTVFYEAFIDGATEGSEYLVFTLESGGCPCNATTMSDTIYVYDNFDLSPQLTGDTLICLGQNSTLDLSLNPALDIDLVDITWSTGDTTLSITDSPATTTTYTVNIQDPCSQDTTLEITVEVVPNINTIFEISPDSVCINEPATVTFTGSSGPNADFIWDFDGGVIVSGTDDGPYEVYWTTPGQHSVNLQMDDNGCMGNATETLTVSDIPTSDFIVSPDIICHSDTINLTYTGTASASASYTWNVNGADIVSGSGQGPISISWQNDGNQTVTLEVKENGCTSDITESTVYNPPYLSTTLITDNISCPNGNSGSVDFDINGGVAPYDYTWSSGDGTELQQGDYTVTITDDLGCQDTISFTITAPNPFVYTPDFTHLSCYQNQTGTITATLNGGSPPYVYSWSHDPSNIYENDSLVTNLDAGTYYLTITDDSLCTVLDTFVITEPLELIASIVSTTDVSCYLGSDGTITGASSGGTSPYSYLWDSGSNSSTATGLNAGNYTLSITDNNGCQDSISASIGQPSEFTSSISGQDASCFGGTDGSVAVSANGGTNPYFYQWNPPQPNTPSVNDCLAGLYSVTISDINGCTTSQQYTVGQPTQITYATSSDSVTCFGYSDGSASIFVDDGTGTPGYTILWSNSYIGTTVNGLASDIYHATITDANGCNVSASVFVPEPQEVITSVSPDTVICKNGQAIIHTSSSGGSPGYTYTWNTGDTTANLVVNPVTTSEYYVYSEDSKGCESETNSIKVYVKPELELSLSASRDTVCPGDASVLSFSGEGGDGNYTYTLQTGEQISSPYTAYPPETMYYSINIEDGCETNPTFGKIMIHVLESPENNFEADLPSGCVPHTVHFNETSPHEGQTYFWNFGDTEGMTTDTLKNPTHTYTQPGVYPVSLLTTSEFGCTKLVTENNFIHVWPLPTANFEPDPHTASILYPEITFTNLSILSDTCYWDFGDNSEINTICNPVHFYTEPGVFEPQLIVATEHSCYDTISFSSIVINDDIAFYAPTAITPQSDASFNNQIFSPKITGMQKDSYQMMIYDRWGHKIFETDKYDVSPDGTISYGWDGRVYGKKLAKTGVYTWYIIYKDIHGVEHEETGTVTVIR
ncbi:MAG: hypothetical protein C0594_01210 [Marinilabiliales bacterium]|nr:MAG: hypothetical protein C0594_01210 [Marinilabiliales bacterium]